MDVEESLDLRRVHVDHQRPVRHPRVVSRSAHQLRRNRNARLVLAVLPGVAEVRNHHRDAPGRRPLQRIDQQQQLHQELIQRIAGRLYQENIRTANVLQYLYLGQAIGEFRNVRLPERKPGDSRRSPSPNPSFAVPEKIFHLSSWRARTGFFSPFGSLLWVGDFFSGAVAEVAASTVTTGETVLVFVADSIFKYPAIPG